MKKDEDNEEGEEEEEVESGVLRVEGEVNANLHSSHTVFTSLSSLPAQVWPMLCSLVSGWLRACAAKPLVSP